MGQALENDLKNGTLRAEYSLSNVTIGAPIGQPLAGNMDITLTDANLLYSAADSTAYGQYVQASYVSSASSQGVAVSFYIAQPITNGDWDAFIIKNESSYKYNVTLPNLDTTDYRIRKWPEMTNLINAGAYNAFLNTKGFVTVSINSNGTVVYYMNGVKMIAYNSGDVCSGDDGGTVGSFVSNLLSGIASSGFYFANGVSGATDLMVTQGLTDSQAMQIYNDYKEYAPENFEERDYDYEDSGITVIAAPTGTYSATAFGPVADATVNGIAVSFKQNNKIPDTNDTANNDWSAIVFTSSRLRITLPNLDPNFYEGGEGLTGTNKWPDAANLYNGGAWNSFLNNETYYATVSINTDGSIVYYKNGVKVIAYSATDTLGNGTQVSVLVSVILREIQTYGFGFGNSLFSAEDVTVTSAVSDAQALTLYNNKDAVSGDHDCAADGHFYDSEKSGSACTGFTVTYTCRYCSDSYQMQTLEGVTGHNYELIADVASTCTTHGYATYKCSVCGDEVVAEKPLAAHTVGDTWEYGEVEIDGVLTKVHWKECSVCHEKTGLAAHVRTEIITKYPTCTEEGSKTIGCTICDYEEIVPIEKTAHTSTGEW